MIIDILIPSPGESISEVEISSWLVANGVSVEKDQEIAEVESDKATMILVAPESGVIDIKVPAHTTVKVGSCAASINTEGLAISADQVSKLSSEAPSTTTDQPKPHLDDPLEKVKVSPVAKKMMDEHGMSIDDVISGIRRITASDIEHIKEDVHSKESIPGVPQAPNANRTEKRENMSQLRKKLAQRLVAVKNETAMLTTFNEVDMSAVIDLRNRYQKEFQEKYGVKLGFMSIFTKAAVEALKKHPALNSMIDGNDIVTPSYYDISIAVQTPKGLMVPVVRNAQNLMLAEIESAIQNLADKGRSGGLTIEDMSGGTFTITNGGVFGSMMSTPIINPPQAAILGMHSIIDRPVAINGSVEIRPMMYIALSYDHRLVDGKDSVGFLVDIKQMVENPFLLLL